MKNSKLVIAGVIASLLPIGIFAFGYYLNWSAENDARKFCDAIALGSDVTIAITKFEQRVGEKGVLHYSTTKEKGETFIFPGLVMDRAYCGVALDENGKVIAKHSELTHD